MENKQAITNMKQGKNIPYKHETITTLITMANKLENIKQIIDGITDESNPMVIKWNIKEVLEKE